MCKYSYENMNTSHIPVAWYHNTCKHPIALNIHDMYIQCTCTCIIMHVQNLAAAMTYEV